MPVLVLGYYNPWLAAKALDQPIKGVDAAAKAYTALSTAIESAAKTSGTTFVGLDQAFSTNDTTPTKINGRVGAGERRGDLHAHQHLHRLRHPPHRRGRGHRGPGAREGGREGRRLLIHRRRPAVTA